MFFYMKAEKNDDMVFNLRAKILLLLCLGNICDGETLCLKDYFFSFFFLLCH